MWVIGGKKLELPISIGAEGRLCGAFLKRSAILSPYIFKVLPQVKELLNSWENEARFIPDPILRRQALDSLHKKAFHCQGGAVYAVPGTSRHKEITHFIVAYQTLCDYLDNLCDRAGSTDGQAFEQLHLSLLDALTPGQCLGDYYKYYPLEQDGGYINKLVWTCQASLRDIPGYCQIEAPVKFLAGLYSDLQVKKHLGLPVRHEALSNWALRGLVSYDGIMWQEYSAACGSTLAIFALLRQVMNNDRVDADVIKQICQAYFPWINGLHILMDYFIDRSEDRMGGDLNFTFYYKSELNMQERLEYFTRQSLYRADCLPEAHFHRTVVHGLLAMYLSDSKVREQKYEKMAGRLLSVGGTPAWLTYRLCRIVRLFL